MDSSEETLLNKNKNENKEFKSFDEKIINNISEDNIDEQFENNSYKGNQIDDLEKADTTETLNFDLYTGKLPEDELIKTLREHCRLSGYAENNDINDHLNIIGLKEFNSMVNLNTRDINEMDTTDTNDVCNENAFYNSNNNNNINDINTSNNINVNINIPQNNIRKNSNLPKLITNFIDNNRVIDLSTPKDRFYESKENPFDVSLSLNNSLFLTDGIRSVDFVLAWEKNQHKQIEFLNNEKRILFEKNLLLQGLEIERESIEHGLNFIKIHAPLDVLRRYAEILKLRMPMKESLCTIHRNEGTKFKFNNAAQYIAQKFAGLNRARNTRTNIYIQLKGFGANVIKKFQVDEKAFPHRSHRFTAIYSRDKEYLFDLEKENFFSASVRSRIVQFILDRQKFSQSEHDDFAFGIERLVSENVYLAAYPLHDGEVNIPGSMRYRLFTEWASLFKWYKCQPLDAVKEYFGVKIGLYFAWLGYYTYMLLLASFVGVLCFLYSSLTLSNNIPTKQICSGEPDIKMCPQCDHWCDYWSLKETCSYAKISYLIDNSTTVFFAVFMSFWATLFLELWKRYSAEITHRWDLTGFDIHEEHPRPQYLARLAHVRKMKLDYVTDQKEPHPPFWRMKLPATVFSFSIVILLVMLAMAAVLGVIVYRMSVLTALSLHRGTVNTSSAIMITTITAATINLCLIFFFNYMYTYLAEYLTELELLRTQTEFDDSLTLKIYLLQFINYYASIFYIAFFKGKFVGHPGDYIRWFKFRQEECSYGGCFTELCIQLAIIMIGKQTMNSILEMIMPIFWKWVNVMRVGWFNRNRHRSTKRGKGERWLRDLKLVEWGPRSLFPEYLEMVLQYGFVTIFVSAFPLAPLFALLNNIMEMRLDAQKLLTYYQRPVAQRVKDIGVWYRILDSIGKLSVITNGFIIAFTSDFIPRLVYTYTESSDHTLNGYLNYTLSVFDTTDFQNISKPSHSEFNLKYCRYPDFREPPSSDTKYTLSGEYYLILACRLAFVVIFENFVALVMIIVRWCIPDMSVDLRDQIRREAYITNEIIIKQETLRARAERKAESNLNEIDSIEPPLNLVKMEKLMTGNLSQSELDLVIHGPDDPRAPGHSPPDENFGVRRHSDEITLDTPDIGPASF